MKRLLMSAAIAAIAAMPMAGVATMVEAKSDKAKEQGKGKIKIKSKSKAHAKAKGKDKDKGKDKAKYKLESKSDGIERKVKVETKGDDVKYEEKIKIKDAGAAIGAGAGVAAGAAALGASLATGADALPADVAARLNCPPGLAKRNPPCVPPGQAKKGVTTEEWTGYDRDELRRILRENDDVVAEVEVEVEEDRYLTEAEIIDIFELEPLQDGYHYAVIDGQIVRMDEEDYLLLQQLRTIAQLPGVDADLVVEPTVSLSQEELISIYKLPEPPADTHYAVVDGTVVTLGTEAYDLLQLIRLTSAVL
ncbi:hypothetical protein BV394_14130 [Brevirhabdus pacifica]|uniref:Uncharacterized protein n=1 Tax=Brevirhabdus pacifica TaxID=1267768 RepID=A0A1U7DL63_9RHOB|nr:hypothetical protein [Brevirhabdus pacifica]APX90711.1 hypothetical protein BV394_14130 [Brevirhabdus pacifica]PJJ85133.1 hypothetical protein CLV77_1994 [Brevirhabdus pacifica]